MSTARPLDRPREERLEALWSAAARGRLPHALGFFGPRGVGKWEAALRLAQGLLCQGERAVAPGPPCGRCGACLRAARLVHADLFVIDVAFGALPPGEEHAEAIRIDRILRRPSPPAWSGPVLEEFLALRAHEGGWRVVLVREAERLAHAQSEAQSAMLKMLEEPGQDLLFCLESSAPERLLATVLSRLVLVAFGPPEPGTAERVLRARGVPAERAALLERWSRGAPGQALELERRGGAQMRRVLGEFLSGGLAPGEASSSVLSIEGEYPGASPAAQERERARVFLDLALDVVRDLRAHREGLSAARLAHGDLLEAGGLPALRPASLRPALDELFLLRADLELKLDGPAAIEGALDQLAELAGARP